MIDHTRLNISAQFSSEKINLEFEFATWKILLKEDSFFVDEIFSWIEKMKILCPSQACGLTDVYSHQIFLPINISCYPFYSPLRLIIHAVPKSFRISNLTFIKPMYPIMKNS